MAVVAGAVLLALRYPLNHDVAWFLSIARRILGGESLYTDVIDINPPLIAYLMMPPVILADSVDMPDTAALGVFVLLLGIWSLGTCLHALDVRGSNIFWWTVLLGFVLIVGPGYDFGQREHLLVILTLPYLFVKWRRVIGLPVDRWLTISAGLAGGVGFAIKPFFLAFLLGLEVLGQLLNRRAKRFQLHGELYVAGAVLGLYSVFIALRHPEYFVLMKSLGPVYRDFGTDMWRIAILSLGYALPALPIALAVRRIGRPTFTLIILLVAYGTIGLLLAVLQAKGWHYHFLPSLVAIVLAAGVLMGEHVRRAISEDARGVPQRLLAVTTILIGLGLMVVQSRPWLVRMQAHHAVVEDRVEMLRPCDGASVLVLGDLVAETYPLVNHLRMDSASPYASMWWLRALYGARGGGLTIRSLTAMDSLERRFHGLQVRQFVRETPELILVDTAANERFAGHAFPYVPYFSQDSSFSAEWANYERSGSIDYLGVWTRRGSRCHCAPGVHGWPVTCTPPTG